MSKFGGFGGGGGFNMQQMMKQAQKMQEQIAKAQEELAETEVEGTSGGGLVSVVLTGKRQMVGISIKPEAIDPDDLEMLEDLIIAAHNDAMEEVERLEQEKLPSGAAGLF